LFETKRGTCSDFATAMTILAREAGLPARYVEGFSVSEWNYGLNQYIVRAKHGHAFPEVYIDGVWVIFEPTISGIERERIQLSYTVILQVLIGLGMVVILTVFFVVFVIPQFRERMFRLRVLHSPRELQIKLVYDKIYSIFMRELRLKERTLSSRDLDVYAFETYKISLHNLTVNYDRIVYGDGAAYEAGDDFYELYERFRGSLK
jgi:transglutaminase-like putative cysteine protease